MKLNTINLTDASKFLASAAVIYGSAFINNTFNAWIYNVHFWQKYQFGDVLLDGNFKAALCLIPNHSLIFDTGHLVESFKNEFAKQAFFTVGAYKLVDSVFSFDSIHTKAGVTAAVGALGGIVESILTFRFFEEGFTRKFCTLVGFNMLCKGAAAAALTYIWGSNSEDASGNSNDELKIGLGDEGFDQA